MLCARDRRHCWHPFTQAGTTPPPIAISSGRGAYLYAEDGSAYLDLISSWWVNLHGHAHPALVAALAKQAGELEHVMFADFTHAPAVELCEQLYQLLPLSLARFFFSDSGATAVEAALKIAYQYWRNKGETKRRYFLSFANDYHGDTMGAMAVSKDTGFYDHYLDLLCSTYTIPFAATWDDDPELEAKEAAALRALNDYLTQRGAETAALIIEPLIQGQSGMRMCRASFVRQVVERVQEAGILVIFDEVMTGFYRTGSMFAFEQVGVTPDLLCLAKGLTGGFLPLALTIASENVYAAFVGDSNAQAFQHGHSYTANPLGCAVALASLQLLRAEESQQNIKALISAQTEGLIYLKQALANHATNFRQLGTITACALNAPIATSSFLKHGLNLRPLGTTLYLLPPYCTTAAELAQAYAQIGKIVRE